MAVLFPNADYLFRFYGEKLIGKMNVSVSSRGEQASRVMAFPL